MPSPYRASPAKRHWWSSLQAERDLRVIAATNKNLREAVKEGAFGRISISGSMSSRSCFPSMRERPEDILPLARFVIEHYNRKFRCGIEGVSPAAAPRTEIPSEGLSLEDNQCMLLARGLEKIGGNQTQAARLLRIARDTLQCKMKKFNLR